MPHTKARNFKLPTETRTQTVALVAGVCCERRHANHNITCRLIAYPRDIIIRNGLASSRHWQCSWQHEITVWSQNYHAYVADSGWTDCLLVSCLTSQQHASASQGGSAQTIIRAATLKWKLQIKLSASPCHSILTPSQPVPALTL